MERTPTYASQIHRHSIYRLRQLLKNKRHTTTPAKVLKDAQGREIVRIDCEDCMRHAIMVMEDCRVKGSAIYHECELREARWTA